MLSAGFLSFFVFTLHGSLFYFIFSVYFLFFKNSISKYTNYADLSNQKKSRVHAKATPQVFFSFIRYTYFYLSFFLLTFRSFNLSFFFKHISVESFNFSVYFLVVFFFFLLSIFFEFFFINLKQSTLGIDFFIALWLFFVIAPFCVFANTLLTFFFFLEFGSILTLYLIISAKDFFKTNLSKKQGSSNFFNSVFFQFWASFFSSILLVYSIVNLFYIFGTTEWAFLNFFLEKSLNSGNLLIKSQLFFTVYLFIFSILIKMGIAPFLFFKIEIYRGLPLLVLFFYSIVYFFFFFTLFMLVFLYYFYAVIYFLSIPIFCFLLLSTIIFTINLFNLFLLKNFFALSSLVNSLMFFFLIFSYAL